MIRSSCAVFDRIAESIHVVNWSEQGQKVIKTISDPGYAVFIVVSPRFVWGITLVELSHAGCDGCFDSETSTLKQADRYESTLDSDPPPTPRPIPEILNLL